jgi:superfamily II DNA or RNA helicase
MAKPKITLLRSGNRIVVDPTTDRVRGLLVPYLTYTETRHYYGMEKRERLARGLPDVEAVDWEVYGDDHRGRLHTSAGFVDAIRSILLKAGYPSVEQRWATSSEAARQARRLDTAYKPDWARIEALGGDGFEFRYRQREGLGLFAEYECGRIDCPPAWGKGTLIRLACTLFPRAKIAVVTRSRDVLTQRLYPELAAHLPSVGLITGGKRIKGRRVTCYTSASLHHVDGDEDFVFVDECHQAASDECAYHLGSRFGHARFWGFSATHDMRADGKDKRVEAIFGPVRMCITPKEAATAGVVLPVTVFWMPVHSDDNPVAGVSDPIERKRRGIWTHDLRNKLIARAANTFADDVQTLITVETIEHALHLKKLLPDYTLVYSDRNLDDKTIARLTKKGLIDDSFRPMTPDRRDRITRRFERGKLKKAIATTVWNIGVDFRKLQILIRGDGGSSPTNDRQIPGRPMRVADGKVAAVVVDFDDHWDSGFRNRSARRRTNYLKAEWKQFSVAQKSVLASLLPVGAVL